MKRINYILYLALLLLFGSCGDSLEEINKNPNATEDPEPAYLLSAAEYHSADWFYGADLNYNATLLWVQHWAKIQYTEPDCYNVSSSSFTDVWNTAYATIIADLVAIENSEKSNSNLKAVAKIWKAWTFLQLTNLFGDIPYTEYGQSVTPAYDKQQTVLEGLITDLQQAEETIQTDGDAISGDLIYDNDLTLWKKFAKSLELRIALEIADREPDKAKSLISDLYDEKSELISSVDENAKFTFTSSPQWNPWANAFSTRDDQRVSKTLIDKLKELSDPRLPVYAQLPADESVTTYEGGANGLSADQANSQGFDKLSKPGTYFLADDAPAVFFTYAEVNFIFAEAAARGFISADAKTLYEEGIKASLEQYQVADSVEEYLQQEGVAYDADNWAELIGWQKWISYYGQAADAFTDWRRLGYPELTPGPASVLDDGLMPRRLLYPSTEQSLNTAGYNSAIEDQGSDELTTRLWFDVEDKDR